MKAFLHTFTLATLLDVAFCTLIVRMFLGWLIGNHRLARLLLILLGLAAFFFAIGKANLPVTQILTTALIVPVVALVVLNFLPDLRRAYQAATLRQLFFARSAIQDNPIPALSAALAEMARIRCGTILIFPRGDDVDAFLNGGEEYDALVTKSLLLSLCHPACPRHDGALMIRNGRVVRVGAVLPLSVSDDGKEEWGTRHLAALGLTERCDADVLVVSEERGTLSHARHGVMREVEPTEERIARLLETILHPDGQPHRSRHARLVSLGAWAAALLIAAILVPTVNWVNRPTREGRTTNLMLAQAPIYVTNVPDGLYLETTDTLRAEVTLRVPTNRETGFNPSFGITVDLKDYPPGSSVITLTSRMVYDLPPGWEVERYSPEQIRITLTPSRDRDVPVTPQFIGLAAGWKILSSSVSPPLVSLRIKDNRPLVGLMATTLPIDLSSAKKAGSYTFDIGLDLPPTIQVRKGRPDTVRVKVQLGR